MTNEELVELIQNEPNPQKRNALMVELWELNVKFVRKMAFRYQGVGEIEDLMQEAYFGFVEAVNKYSKDRGALFISYCGYWIKSYMHKYLVKDDTLSVSHNAKDLIVKYKCAYAKIKQQTGSVPTLPELSAALQLPVGKVMQLEVLTYRHNTRSLDEFINADDSEDTLGSLLPSSSNVEQEVLDHVYQEQLYEALWETVELLPEQEAGVIHKRYENGETLRAVGEHYGVTPERIRCIEAAALRKLRVKCKKNPTLKEYSNSLRDTSKAFRSSSFWNDFTSPTERVALEDLGYRL